MQKIHLTCAYLVERRENYLYEEGFTGVVDKIELLHDILVAELTFQTQKLTYL